MDNQALQESQRRLEERRESLKQTGPEQTFLTELEIDQTLVSKVCTDCDGMYQVPMWLSKYPGKCPTCHEKEEAARLEQQASWEASAHQRKIAKRIEECRIGERFIGMAFGDYIPQCPQAEVVLDKCKRYVDTFQLKSGANILMLGSPGTGKNMLAAIIGQELIKKDIYFFHATALKLVRRIKDSWKNKDETEQQVIDLFVNPDVLAIDEIGVQFGTSTEQLFLTEIINERYEKKRPTILISNLKLSQLTETMGERVIDRFYDDGSMMLVFDWKSYRRK